MGHTTGQISLNQLINTAPHSAVWLAGDFNAPNINWPNLCVPPYINCQQYLLDVIEDHCMMQIVTEPTQDKHIWTFSLQTVLIM